MRNLTKNIIAILVAVVMGVSMATAQTKTISHIVDRGETLESIAKRYGTTKDKILELNQDASQFIYVGMELTIPVTESVSSSTNPKVADISADYLSEQANNNTPSVSSNFKEEYDKKAGFGFGLEVSLGFPPHDSGSFNTYDISVFVPYWINEINKGLFVSAGLGYASAFGSGHSGFGRDSYSSSTSVSLITIPLKAGFALGNNEKFAVVPYVGFNLGLTVSGNTKIKNNGNETKYKIKTGKFAPDFRIGADIRLWSFNVGGYFAIPISDDSKAVFGDSGYFSVAIGFGL